LQPVQQPVIGFHAQDLTGVNELVLLAQQRFLAGKLLAQADFRAATFLEFSFVADHRAGRFLARPRAGREDS